MLHLEDLKFNKNINFEQILLNIDFRLPSFHKSIATPNGNLYLTGGSIDTETAAKGKSKYIY